MQNGRNNMNILHYCACVAGIKLVVHAVIVWSAAARRVLRVGDGGAPIKFFAGGISFCRRQWRSAALAQHNMLVY